MKFMNPSGVRCEACGLNQAHDPMLLYSFSAHCVGCSAVLQEAGRGMRAMILDEDVFATKCDLAIELEDIYGLSLDDESVLPAETVEQYVAGVLAANPTHAAQAQEIRQHVIRYLQKCVPPERWAELENLTFHQLLATSFDAAGVQCQSANP